MKRLILVLAVIAVGATFIGSAYAHHSFAATYFEDKTAKIEGNVVQFLFRNPHSFLIVEAKDEGGTVRKWTIEWGGGGQLTGQGVSAQSLKAGDLVIVTGDLSRNPEDFRLRMRTLTRPSDGFKWGGRANEVVD
jgi:hypothetical protein